MYLRNKFARSGSQCSARASADCGPDELQAQTRESWHWQKNSIVTLGTLAIAPPNDEPPPDQIPPHTNSCFLLSTFSTFYFLYFLLSLLSTFSAFSFLCFLLSLLSTFSTFYFLHILLSLVPTFSSARFVPLSNLLVFL